MIVQSVLDPNVIQALCADDLVVLKTDTIYGIVANASSPQATAALYAAKRRSAEKASIILAASSTDIPQLTEPQRRTYQSLLRDRPTTIATRVDDSFLPHLPRTEGTLAFRIVNGDLAALIRQTGFLLAPSANPAFLQPAQNIKEAIEYFGDAVAVYVNSGEVSSTQPSQIITFGDKNQVIYLRK